MIDYQKDQILFHNSYLTICWMNLEVFLTLATRYGLISGIKPVFSNSQIGQQTFMTNSLNPNPSRRVGFLPSKTCFFRTKWEKLDKTCFVQFLPSKTVQNRPKLDETMDSLVKMVILLNYISTGQGLSTKPLLIIMLLKYPIAQTLIAQAMGHFSFAEMPSSN